MIKLVLIAGMLLIAVVLLGFWYDARKRSSREHRAGLRGSKKRIAELETTASKQERCLREIQDIVTSSGVVTGDPLWEMVAQKIDEVLVERTSS